MLIEHIPGTCPWCEMPEEYPIKREMNGITLHGVNITNPLYPGQKIGVEIICKKFDRRAN